MIFINNEVKHQIRVVRERIEIKEDDSLKLENIKNQFIGNVSLVKSNKTTNNQTNNNTNNTNNNTLTNEINIENVQLNMKTFIVQYKTSKGLVYVKMNQLQIDEIINKQQQYSRDFIKQIHKILDDIHQSNCSTFNKIIFKFKKTLPNLPISPTDYKVQIIFCPISTVDLITNSNNQKIEIIHTHQQESHSQPFKNLDSTLNDHIINTSKAIIRFLQGKIKRQLSSINIEYHKDNFNKLWITSIDNIKIFNTSDEIEEYDKTEVVQQQVLKVFNYKCSGIYCDGKGNGELQYCNNEYNNLTTQLFIQKQSSKSNKSQLKVYFKSILLDVVERKKTVDYIQSLFPDLSQDAILCLPENIFNKIRKFYSISDLNVYQQFRHLQVSNYYAQKNICSFCYQMYNKIDDLRQIQTKNDIFSIKINQQQTFYDVINSKDKDFIKVKEIIQDYLDSKETKIKFDRQQINQKFHNNFYKYLNEFDDKFKLKEEYVIKTELRKELPIIGITTVQDINKKNKCGKISKKFVDVENAELLGYKHFLGSLENIKKEGVVISKSSYTLNKIQEQVKYFNKVQLERKELEEYKYVLCSFNEEGRLNTKDYKKFLKQKLNSHPLDTFQVVGDKNQFLSSKQQDQRKQNDNLHNQQLLQKKHFLQQNHSLCQSIFQYQQQ